MEINKEDLRNEVIKLSNTVKHIKKEIEEAELNLVDENQDLKEFKKMMWEIYRAMDYGERNQFFIDNDGTYDQLPSFHFDRFMNAVFNDSIDQLSPDEQVLALCLNFSYSIMDDIQEVLASSNLSYTIEALFGRSSIAVP